jgi:hypothetical protein
MQDQDSIDPGDAALQELIASVADYVDDPVKKEFLLDFLVTGRSPRRPRLVPRRPQPHHPEQLAAT